MRIDAREGGYGRPGDNRTHHPLQAVAPTRHGPVVHRRHHPEAYQDQSTDHGEGVLGEVEDVPAMRVEDHRHSRGQDDDHRSPGGPEPIFSLWPPRRRPAVPIAALMRTPRKRAKLHLTAPVASRSNITVHAGTPSSSGHPGRPTIGRDAGHEAVANRARKAGPSSPAVFVPAAAPADGPAGPGPEPVDAALPWSEIHCGDAARCLWPQRRDYLGSPPRSGDAPGADPSHWQRPGKVTAPGWAPASRAVAWANVLTY